MRSQVSSQTVPIVCKGKAMDFPHLPPVPPESHIRSLSMGQRLGSIARREQKYRLREATRDFLDAEMYVRWIDPAHGEAFACHFGSGRSKPSAYVALLLDLFSLSGETRMCSLDISGDTFPNTDQFPITYYKEAIPGTMCLAMTAPLSLGRQGKDPSEAQAEHILDSVHRKSRADHGYHRISFEQEKAGFRSFTFL